MKPIARDTAYFRGIIEAGKIYVDKTALLHRMILPSSDKFYFLSRPRRFGKSLMISTLGSIFRGERELFKGLAIDGTDYDWKKDPVIQLDMSSIVSNPFELEYVHRQVCNRLRLSARDNGVTLSEESCAPELFQELIVKLSEKNGEGQVVVLIDEYDSPLSGLLNEPQSLSRARTFLNGFYRQLKVNDARIRFLMLTGVSKFTKLSIFSELNNLTMNPAYGALLGYTEGELRQYFAEHIHAFAEKEGVSDEDILREMKRWYDGYHFSKAQQDGIYNPYSIAYSLSNQDFENYWGESGGATIIYERLRANRQLPTDLDNMSAVKGDFDACDTESLPLNALLYQGGYLTIGDYRARTGSYRLVIPNEEVRKTLDTGYVRSCLTFRSGFSATSLIDSAYDALETGDLTMLFDEVVHTLYAAIPSDWQIKDEKEAKRYFLMFFRLLGADIAGEIQSALGKADVVLKMPDAIYIMEFKFNRSVDEALKQIADRDYAGQFAADTRKIVRIGVNYVSDRRTIDWRADS